MRVRDAAVSLAYPADCRICGESMENWDDGVCCGRCWTDPLITRLFEPERCCRKCGAPLARRAITHPAIPETLRSQQVSDCGYCATMPFHAARAVGEYCGALEASILFLKRYPHLCLRLRRLLLSAFQTSARELEGDLIIPVPLHRTRQKERGFNQAEVVSSLLAREFAIPLRTDILSRTRATTRHRFGMDAYDRSKSVDGAFEVAGAESISGARVILVDDLLTTGSTICTASSNLLNAGAKAVSIFTIGMVLLH